MLWFNMLIHVIIFLWCVITYSAYPAAFCILVLIISSWPAIKTHLSKVDLFIKSSDIYVRIIMISVLVTSQSFPGLASFIADQTYIARTSYMLALNMFINIGVVLRWIFTISACPCPFPLPHVRVNKGLIDYKTHLNIKLHFRSLMIKDIVISHGISGWAKFWTNTTCIPSSRAMARFNMFIKFELFFVV